MVEDFPLPTSCLPLFLFTSLLTESWFLLRANHCPSVELVEGRFMVISVCPDSDWSSARRVTQGASGKGLISSK